MKALHFTFSTARVILVVALLFSSLHVWPFKPIGELKCCGRREGTGRIFWRTGPSP